MFAAGELAMTASDLALWDISTIDRTVLKPASYQAMQTDVLLKNGVATGYGLGVQVGTNDGRRQHLAQRRSVWLHGRQHHLSRRSRRSGRPDEPGRDGRVIADREQDRDGCSFARRPPTRTRSTRWRRRRPCSTACSTAESIARCSRRTRTCTSPTLRWPTSRPASEPLGTPQEFEQTNQSLRGGMTARSFRIKCGSKTLRVRTFTMPDGKLEQYQIAAAE